MRAYFRISSIFPQLSADHQVLKLGDFGLARATEGTGQTKTMIGSYRYMAPEVVITGGRYSRNADVHSFGEPTAGAAAQASVGHYRLFISLLTVPSPKLISFPKLQTG